MTKRRVIIIAVFILLVACPLGAAFFMVTYHVRHRHSPSSSRLRSLTGSRQFRPSNRRTHTAVGYVAGG